MKTDQEVIEVFEASKGSPVIEARRRLAPIREFALATKRELEKLQATDGPAIQAAQIFFDWATANGFSGLSLGIALREAKGSGVLPGALQGFLLTCETIIADIDGLGDETLDTESSLKQKKPILSALLAGHKRMIEAIKREHAAMKAIVERQTPEARG